MSKSSIAWTQETWNPTLGCTPVSPGCANCYAVRSVHRMAGNPNPKIAQANEGLTQRISGGGLTWTGRINVIPDRLLVPLKTKKPTTYFVNSLSDLFHPDIYDEELDLIWDVMVKTPQHRYQILTKRPKRMFEYCKKRAYSRENGFYRSASSLTNPHVLPNVWLGVSVENQKAADERIPLLLQTPAAVRFLSCEPLLEVVDLRQYLPCAIIGGVEMEAWPDWVIAGGESGPNHRPMDPGWARSLRDQCQAAGVPFFFKQVGGPTAKAGGRLLDGRAWDEMPNI